MNRYLKFLVGVLTTVGVLIAGYLAQGPITNLEWVNVATVAVGALAVFAGPNVPGAKYTKAVLSGLAAVLVLVNTFIVSGTSFSSPQIWQIVLAFAGAVGVVGVKNTDGLGNNLSETGSVG